MTENRTMGKIDLILIYTKRKKAYKSNASEKARKQSTTKFKTIKCTVKTLHRNYVRLT